MAAQEITDYINKARAENLSNEEILTNLTAAGWSKADVEAALHPQDKIPVPPAPKKAKSAPSMWDAFEHILLFISLYTLATSMVLTLHWFIDKWVPVIPELDQDRSYAYAGILSESWWLRILIASLIVSYPIFSFLFLRITRRTKDNPALRSLRARKVLIYLTLVSAFLIFLTNAIGIVFTFLEGNISFNFILHFLATTLITGIIFTYYLREVKEDRLINA